MSKELHKDTKYKSAKFRVRKQVGVVVGSNKHRTVSCLKIKVVGPYFLANNRALIHVMLLWVVLEGRDKTTILSYGLKDLLDPLLSYWFYYWMF